VPLSLHPREAKMSLGLVPQEFALYPTLSARDNLVFFGRLYGLWGRTLSNRVAHALKSVSLADRADMIVSTYSNGMKRRLNLAIGLLHDPDVMVLDEPTVGIDAHSRHAIVSTLKDLVRSGKTLLYCTHHLWEAETLCSRVGIMDSGQIIALDTPRQLILQYGMGLVYVEFSDQLSDDLFQGLKQIGDVRKSPGRSMGFQIQSSDSNMAMEQVLKLAGEYGATIRSAQLLEPTLETVFLNLTGRSLRD
jgi:ABC-2 type transport system ATP-binding protein